ncbi:MAG: hypothetical protein WDA28_13275, partial [Castellaniella sp.]
PTSDTADLDLEGGTAGGNVSIIKAGRKITLVPAGAAATTLTIQTAQTTNSLAVVPNFGAAADFVMTAGDQIIGGQKTIAGDMIVTGTIQVAGGFNVTGQIATIAAANQIGLGAVGSRTIISAPAAAADRTYTIVDAGANANFVLTAGDRSLAGTTTMATAVVTGNITAAAVITDTITPVGSTVTIAGIDITALDGRVAAAEGDIATNTGDIAALDGVVVKTSGAQTIADAKTFTSAVTAPRFAGAGSYLDVSTGFARVRAADDTSMATFTNNGTWIYSNSTTYFRLVSPGADVGSLVTVRATAPTTGPQIDYTIPAVASSDFVMNRGNRTIFDDTHFTGIVKFGSIPGEGPPPPPKLIIDPDTGAVGDDFRALLSFKLGADELRLASIVAAYQVAARTYTIPDAGMNSAFVMERGGRTMYGTTTFNENVTVTGVADLIVNRIVPELTQSVLVNNHSFHSIDGLTLIGTAPVGTSLAIKYNQYYVWNTTIGGPWVSPLPITYKFMRIGSQVTLQWPQMFSASTGGIPSTMTTTAVMPDVFMPADNMYMPIRVRNNDHDELGYIWLRSDGLIVFFTSSDPPDFANIGDPAGVYGGCVTYIAANV